MIWRLILLAAAAFLAASCGNNNSGNTDAGLADDLAPSPILYEVIDNGGTTRGWLFGTIHSLPADLQWRTPALDQAIESADSLVVEIADLENGSGLRSTFTQLSTTPNQPNISERVPALKRPALAALLNKANYRPSDFRDIETWAAALILAQASSSGDGAAGADRVILREFQDRPIHEFEGAVAQLSIFDQLPESEQSDLLVGVIEEDALREQDPNRLRRAWLAGDETALVEATTSGLMADPELREALLVKRNLAWVEQLVRFLNRGEKTLVAVGAAHIVGEYGLPEMLVERGYTVRRIQ